ncbi:hypothetical protein [Paenibacillus ferrarius]|uniref:hypothetical protein n=1 Tax=Paenibacillus ferrarius TaxID=1469647 RepID=UPI003D2E0FD0
MTDFTFSFCETDEDFAQFGLFFLAHRRDLHPSYATIYAVTALYSYIADGRILQAKLADGSIAGAVAYFHGTPEQDYQDRQTVLLDLAIADRSLRGSRLFLSGLAELAEHLAAHHPEVEEVHIVTLAENAYLRRLYGKFAQAGPEIEGVLGREVRYQVKISELRGFLSKF